MMARMKISRIGVLPVLGGLLMASAFLRIAGFPVSTLVAPMAQASRAEADTTQEPDELAEILDVLSERQAALDARETQLDADAERLAEGRAALAAQLAEIEQAETELRRLLNLADKAAEDDLSRLATVYENMKPAEAGALFEQMPPAFAAGFLGLMGPAASARILAALKPETAYAVSVILAGRNVDTVEN
ncbi:hypothetical protein PARPLA_00159 [Rhodobacteraceae bacterium THAF1]|uniref:MotE family protein n=1 Tax=Palleronia sp. THAF1 TaxID=2587842 RepID=UPI000F3C7AC3|nr:hypothetical protein [Palleronia sp. THAF1]QFU10276.1 hypothetical protein FIU81_16465 [Palleronia sp. THAF1]VDC16819.1 hypothetical protein PARPLA_00159 [Rhodobacteraceae bacterium THAF1]